MMDCPKCSSETLVETPALGNIPLDVCPGCSCIWFDKDELEALLKQSQDWDSADFNLMNPKPKGLICPRCKNNMMRGGLVNPLLLVDKCDSCGGVWLDSNELKLVRKLLNLPEEDSEVKVSRPFPASSIEHRQPTKSPLIKIFSGICAIAGLIGISFEMYLYFSPAESVSHVPSMGLLVLSILLFIGGIFGLLRRK
ncbi:MAG: zf-TFIIB domain-containing protein [Elusimicrobia bacterium]|nr:zf-TFIIB domain-containing protein [Elusimicrobiota bacterium]